MKEFSVLSFSQVFYLCFDTFTALHCFMVRGSVSKLHFSVFFFSALYHFYSPFISSPLCVSIRSQGSCRSHKASVLCLVWDGVLINDWVSVCFMTHFTSNSLKRKVKWVSRVSHCKISKNRTFQVKFINDLSSQSHSSIRRNTRNNTYDHQWRLFCQQLYIY